MKLNQFIQRDPILKRCVGDSFFFKLLSLGKKEKKNKKGVKEGVFREKNEKNI